MRAVGEWQGKTDDTIPPPRVRLRVFDTHMGKCYLCLRKIMAGEYWQLDHVVALCNSGRNVESNLAPACRNCCYAKTALDVAEKAKVARIRSKHLNIKANSHPMSGSRRSKFKRKLDGTTILR